MGLAGLALVASLAAEGRAVADDRPQQQSLPQPTPPGTPGSTTVQAPPGSGGVTVVAPTPGGGQVTASGCSTVVVAGQPTLVTPTGAPCPQLAPYQPYYGPPPQQQPYYQPAPRYARDPDRTGALIASAVGFGVGTAVSGIYYLVQWGRENDRCGQSRFDYRSNTYYEDNSACGTSRASLVTYAVIVSIVPSVPRFVVGDTTKGLIYTGLRAAAVTSAALINWGSDSDTKWQGPFLLGFAAPITLGIIDLATTPHREDLEEKTAKAGITQIAPIALTDRSGHTHGGVLSLGGIF